MLNEFAKLLNRTYLEVKDPDVLAEVFTIGGGCVDPAGHLLGAFNRQYSPSCPDPKQCWTYPILDSQDEIKKADCHKGCTITRATIPFNSACQSKFCNWNSCTGLPEAECKQLCEESKPDPYFCGVCENEKNCIDMSDEGLALDTSEACSEAIVCFLNNGTKILTDSEHACRNTMTCSDCTGVDGECNEANCLQEYECTDVTDPIYGIFTGTLANNSGYCSYQVSNPLPWDQSPMTRLCFGWYLANPLMPCLDERISKEDCVPNSPALNFSPFITSEVRYIERASTKEECEQQKVCWGPVVATANQAGQGDDFKVIGESFCDGNYSSIYKWKQKRTWRGGRPRKPEWTKRVYGPRWQEGGIFNHSAFALTLEEASQKQYFQTVQSYVFCEYFRTLQELEWLVCNCVSGSDDCYNTRVERNVSDIGSYCGGKATTLVAPPFTFHFPNSKGEDTNCYTFLFYHTSIYSLREVSKKPHISNVVIFFDEEYIWGIRNQKNGIWGKVLTDGVYVSLLSPENKTFEDVEIFVQKSSEYKKVMTPNFNNFNTFNNFDVAFSGENGTIIPMNVTVHELEDSFRAVITLEMNRTYWIVNRVNDWEDQTRSVFTVGERAYISILLTSYVILLALALWKIVRGFIYSRKLPSMRLVFIILGIITTFCICRIILFSLLVTQRIVDVTPGIVYMLIEFPILLYFVYVSNYIIMWAFLHKVVSSMSDTAFMTQANWLTFIVNAIITITFLIFVLAYEVIVGDPALACNSQLVAWDEDSAHVITLTYRCVFGAIEIVIGMFLLIVGTTFFNLLAADRRAPEHYVLAKRILAVSIVGCIGLVSQGIIWVIFPGLKAIPSNYMSLSILLLVEIIPTFFFLILITEKKGASTSQDSTKRSASKKSNSED
eukprot:TRINITY_DN5206_c0_g1_i1.p1 TRINITY_DN5206_c0_g1~~TRINITY_DN5206_c0_g1_i1.p1  ORF type:complete len:891 (-),score=93.63 TRINITY_DN5206_c0_g1_i1:410-3082(-)